MNKDYELIGGESPVHIACEIIKMLYEGKILVLSEEPYPIAMGEDFSIGYLYNGNIVCDFTFKQVVSLVQKHSILPVPQLKVGEK